MASRALTVHSSLTSTAFTIEGYRVVQTLGVVRGITVRSRSVFGTAIAGRAGDFNFNCDASTTRRWTTTGATCPAATTTGACVGVDGWDGSTAPACGVTAPYSECRLGSFLGMTGHYNCTRIRSMPPQECR